MPKKGENMMALKHPVLSLMVAVTVVLVSCESTPKLDTGEIPEWYKNPPTSKEALYGVGSAKLSSLDLSRTAAVGKARDDIARQISTTVKNALTDYAQEAGESENKQTLTFVENTSRQVANVTLNGTRTEKVAVGESGTVYAMVSFPFSNLIETAKSEFSRNEASAYAEFKATEALKRLEDELEKNPPKAGQ